MAGVVRTGIDGQMHSGASGNSGCKYLSVVSTYLLK